MPSFGDAKSMARAMADALRAKQVIISHGECLDIVARQLGLKDWNVLSARAKEYESSSRRRASQLKGWAFIAEHPDVYDHGADEDPQGCDGGPPSSASIPCLVRVATPNFPAHSGYVQTVSAVPFHGKRVEICANLRCRDVTHGATIWVRVTGRW